MKILQISSAKNFGGGEKHLVDLTQGLQIRGHEVFLAVPEDSPVLEKLEKFSDENVLRVKIKNSADIFAAQKIEKFIRQNRIEIVHAHAAKDYLPVSLAVRFAPPAKLILTRHVLFSMRRSQKFALGNVAIIIAVSSAVEANLEKTFPKEKIVKIPNGIEIEKWADADKEMLFREFRFLHNIPFDAQLVGTVGELKRLKGQQDFVLAANEIAKKSGDAHFVIVGKDNSYKKDFRRELKRLVKVFGLEDKFLFLDWIEDTAPLLSALDIFVSPSHSESFGLAILEAMACGKAIVATTTEGAKELIEDGKSGKLAAIKEPLEIARAIQEFLSDKKMRETFGKNAQTIAREKFSLQKMIEQTEKVYQSILD
jgi:glycosyltransferase involved in cell wall biosynthesis